MPNTCIVFENDWYTHLVGVGSLGIMIGLFIGKPLGISLFSYLAVKLNVSKLPSKVRWGNIVGVGVLGGIGFTMSIFITLLAFDNEAFETNAKLSIIVGSLISGIAGFIWLKTMFKKPSSNKRLIHRFLFQKNNHLLK